MQKSKKNARQYFGEWRHWGLLLISPWLAGFFLLKFFPILASLALSLTNFYLLEPQKTEFVGLQYYIQFLHDPDMYTVLNRTIMLALAIIPVQLVSSVCIAALLSNRRLLAKNTMRTLFFLPSVIPSAAFIFMWQGFFNPASGWLNRLFLNPLGLAGLNHLSGRGAGNSLFILTSLWTIGPGMLILMGSMQGIAPELYEAAQVDGAGRFRRFFSITLPLITPAIFFTLILNLTAVFGGAVMMDRGYNFDSNLSSYDSYIYFYLFRVFKLGAATSLAWIFLIFTMAIVITLFITSKYWVYYPDPEKRA